jgi:hypothetical protein
MHGSHVAHEVELVFHSSVVSIITSGNLLVFSKLHNQRTSGSRLLRKISKSKNLWLRVFEIVWKQRTSVWVFEIFQRDKFMKVQAQNWWFRVGSVTQFFDFFRTPVKGQNRFYDF